MHNLMQGTEPFVFGIRTPQGDAFMDELCVDSDRTSLENLLSSLLNKEQEEGGTPFEVVPLYTAEQVTETFAALLSSVS